MNKTELISAVAKKAGMTQVESKKAVEALFETISEQLKAGDKISVLGFGTFSVSEKAARTGINPRTKETIEIAARKVVKFKPGSELADAIK
ncbi:MAG TPA: DNA-binding protein [Parabacteroides sp.]|nr:DNA-binding protein [Parabacteroides sp.]